MRELLRKYRFTLIISLIVFFLVGYQVYRITQLDLHYLGEEISFHIAPSYIIFLVMAPLALLLIVLLPGFVIVFFTFKLPIFNPKFNRTYFIYTKRLNMSFVRIFDRSKLYKIFRC